MRTISYLTTLAGRVYVYLPDLQTGTLFLKLAEQEGFTFEDGKIPTARGYSELMAVNHDQTLNYVGMNGHIAFGAGAKEIAGEPLIRIDMKKYLSGDKDFYFKEKGL